MKTVKSRKFKVQRRARKAALPRLSLNFKLLTLDYQL